MRCKQTITLALIIACSACSYASPSNKSVQLSALKPILSETSLDRPLYQDSKASLQTVSKKDFGIVSTPNAKSSALALKAFDNASLTEVLKFSLEDSTAVQSIRDQSCYSIVARVVNTKTTTHPISSLWNTIHGVSMTWILGVLPYRGSLDVEVQLRMYKDGTLIGKYPGVANSTWGAHGNPFKNISKAKLKAFKVAAPIAVQNAVGSMLKDISKQASLQEHLPLTCDSNIGQAGLRTKKDRIASLER